VTRLYNPVPKDLKNAPKQNSKHLKVGMFARYTPWKGHEDLIRLAKTCRDEPIHFVSYGNVNEKDEPYYDYLQEMAQGLSNLALKGFVNDIYREMQSCDAVLHLSKLPESFGRILTEANACGTPVLAYKGGAVEELFENLDLGGQMFEVGDWQKMAESLKNFDHDAFHVPDLEQLYPEKYTYNFIKVANK
jgi:glycosyltransferase involved in cell wall biosynthesis